MLCLTIVREGGCVVSREEPISPGSTYRYSGHQWHWNEVYLLARNSSCCPWREWQWSGSSDRFLQQQDILWWFPACCLVHCLTGTLLLLWTGTRRPPTWFSASLSSVPGPGCGSSCAVLVCRSPWISWSIPYREKVAHWCAFCKYIFKIKTKNC